MDQNKLLECMEEIKTIAESQQNIMTKEEVKRYLSHMELTDAQLDAVFRYLGTNHIQVKGYLYTPEESQDNAGTDGTKEEVESVKEKTKAEINLQTYRKELSVLDHFSIEQEKELFRRFLAGESQLRNQLIENWLIYVSEIAVQYKKHNVPLEEVIAEGNLGLVDAMLVIEQGAESFLTEDGQPDMDKIMSVIQMEVKQSIERMIDELSSDKDWEGTILAKTNLLHEAAKYLAEEMERVATWEELEKYTKIPIEEIKNIMNLSEDAKKAAKPE